MLPFMKLKKQGAVMQAKPSEGGTEPMNEEEEHSPGIMSAAEDLISAVHSKDARAVADALKAHHEIREMEDYDEEPEGSGAY